MNIVLDLLSEKAELRTQHPLWIDPTGKLNPNNHFSAPEEEAVEEEPIWTGAIAGFVGALETGLIQGRPEEVFATMGQVITELMKSGMVRDLSEVQRYLEKRDGYMQIFAISAKNGVPLGCEVVDILSGEPRDHWLSFSYGRTEIQRFRAQNGIDSEENLRLLRDQTGILTLRTDDN